MKPASAPRRPVGRTPCHPERVGRAVARGIRNLSALLWLLPLTLFVVSCESLPAAPNIPPTAAFIFNPVSPITAGETPVTFNAVGSRDSDGSITGYTWSWGDGTPDQSTTGPTIVHVFTDTSARCLEITYTVLLAVVDDKGESATASQRVTVIEAPVPGSPECTTK